MSRVGAVFSAARDEALLLPILEAARIEPSDALRVSLAAYVQLVATWTLRVDLVSAKDARSLVELLLLDASVLAGSTLVPRGAKVLDVGAGAGAPTIPLALMREDLRFMLLEPRQKRCAFMRTALGTLGLLDRGEVREARLEPGAEAALGSFDLALSRATFAPARWLELGQRLAPRLLALTAADEPPEAPQGLKLQAIERYRVPSTGAPRAISAYERS